MSGNVGDPMPLWKLGPNRVTWPADQKRNIRITGLGIPYMEERATIASDIFSEAAGLVFI
jgi:hypothetical protein